MLRRVVAALLIVGAFWCWYVIQRDVPPVLDMLSVEESRSIGGILARIGFLCFLSAAIALGRLRWLPSFLRPPGRWFRPLVLVGAGASALLFLLYLGPWSIVPLLIDAGLAWGVIARGWDVPSLAGAEEDDRASRRRW
jgi:hypothetical protein